MIARVGVRARVRARVRVRVRVRVRAVEHLAQLGDPELGGSHLRVAHEEAEPAGGAIEADLAVDLVRVRVRVRVRIRVRVRARVG